MDLIKRLEEYSDIDFYPFHMPGHKRNASSFDLQLPFGIDITEIENFDDLHHGEGCLLEAQQRAARVFGAEESHFLINGSTVGILASILGTTNRGDKILVARNCHKSVYNGVELNGLDPIYLYPKIDGAFMIHKGIEAEHVASELENKEGVKAVIIVSPTYEGVVSDIEGIAEVTRRYGIPLIVDEAHGAHLNFHSYFPKSAVCYGADIVIQSLHKTLPSLTQTALLHLNGELVDRGRIKKYLIMLQSSSPSYVLMASIDSCVSLLEREGTFIFAEYVKNLEELRGMLKSLKKLRLVTLANMEKSKVVIATNYSSISSKELYKRLLEEYHIQLEMVSPTYVLAMTSIGDTKVGFDRLAQALLEIEESIAYSEENSFTLAKPIKQAELARNEAERAGKYYYLYPPGIPIATPNERLTDEMKALFEEYRKNGFEIQTG